MAAEAESDMCWICLEEASENGSHQLVSPCKCPRKVHPQCLARWQLQQAGRHEEKFCRFCNNELADWKRHLTPEELKPEVSKVQPIMVVYFEGQIHRIPVKQGPDGLDEFTGKIRELFRLPEDVDISLTFGCKEPMSGTHLKLEGMGAFDAAVHCASVAAAERQQKIKKSYSTGNLGSTPALSSSGPDASQMPRSASINNMPASNATTPAATVTTPSSAVAGAAGLSPATPPLAAGPSAASLAAQDRRQVFHAQQQQHQQEARTRQQPPAAAAGSGNGRSRSFSAFSSAGPRSTGVEPPAAFRSILGMLNNNSSNSTGQQAPQGGSAAGAAAGGAGGALPQASPRAGLPPLSPSAAAAVNAGQAAAGAAAPQQRQQSPQQQQSFKRERLSLRQISELKDVPEVDETVAVGSLSGKFKLHLKAFSRKVARSLSFTNRPAGMVVGAGGSASCGGSSGSVTSMDELRAFAPSPAGAAGSINLTSDSSSRALSFSAASGSAASGTNLSVPVGQFVGSRTASPLPPTTPPSIYTC